MSPINFEFIFFSYPFNVNTLHGYFAYLIMVIIALHTYAVLITTQAGFFLGASFYLDAFTEDFDQQMTQLNQFKQRDSRSIDAIQTRIFNAVKFNIQIIEFVFLQFNCKDYYFSEIFSVFSINWVKL